MTFDDALRTHLELLKSQGAAFVRVINPPTTSRDAVYTRLAEVAGAAAPDELVSWFCWQDGVVTEGHDPSRPIPAMLGGYVPLGLEDSLQRAGIFRLTFDIPVGQPNPWVPIASDWARTLVVNSESGSVYRFFDWEFSGQVTNSITALLEAWTEFVETEAIWDDASGLWKTRTAWTELDQTLAARIGYSGVSRKPQQSD